MTRRVFEKLCTKKACVDFFWPLTFTIKLVRSRPPSTLSGVSQGPGPERALKDALSKQPSGKLPLDSLNCRGQNLPKSGQEGPEVKKPHFPPPQKRADLNSGNKSSLFLNRAPQGNGDVFCLKAPFGFLFCP